MLIKEVKQYSLSLADVKQAETKDGKWTVFMKENNVFMLVLHSPIFQSIAIKLPIEKGLELQDEYNIVSDSILNMKGWLDVDLGYDFPSSEVKAWIKESYDLVSQQMQVEEQEKYISLSSIIGVK